MLVLVVKIFILLISTLATGDFRVLFFTMQGCPPCRQTEPNIDRLAGEGVSVTKVDARQQPQTAAQFGVFQTPTTIIVRDNQIVSRFEGAMTYADLRQMIHAAGGTKRRRPKSVPSVAAKTVTNTNNSTRRPNVGAPGMSAAQRAFQATVRLRVEDQQGTSFATGTIIHKRRDEQRGDEALVLTCGHVFRDSAGKGIIRADLGFAFGDPQTVNGSLVFYNADAHDVALVAIPCSLPIEPVSIAPESLSVQTGDQVFSIGCDRGAPPSVRKSVMKAVSRYSGVIKYDTVGRPVDGRSGGGLFSHGGQLIGVCNAAAVEVDEGIYTGLNSIYWQFAETNLTHLFKRPVADTHLIARVTEAKDAPANATNLENRVAIDPVNSAAESAESLATQIPRRSTNPADPIRPTSRAGREMPAITNVSNTRTGTDEFEVIMLVRSKNNPHKVETITINNPNSRVLDFVRSAGNSESVPANNRLARARQLRNLDLPSPSGNNADVRAQSPR